MLKLVVGVVLLVAQLSGPGGTLPQILHPDFKATTPIKAGKLGEVMVSFSILKGLLDQPYTTDQLETHCGSGRQAQTNRFLDAYEGSEIQG
ncbi:MAG: hypothetical protein DMG13_09370 [Acidobacteria bacterium]|nr:MAG: hypothetical protein DMG13_09370 [Acidobacteriota bacterium]